MAGDFADYRVLLSWDEETELIVADIPTWGIADDGPDAPTALDSVCEMALFHIEGLALFLKPCLFLNPVGCSESLFAERESRHHSYRGLRHDQRKLDSAVQREVAGGISGSRGAAEVSRISAPMEQRAMDSVASSQVTPLLSSASIRAAALTVPSCRGNTKPADQGLCSSQ